MMNNFPVISHSKEIDDQGIIWDTVGFKTSTGANCQAKLEKGNNSVLNLGNIAIPDSNNNNITLTAWKFKVLIQIITDSKKY